MEVVIVVVVVVVVVEVVIVVDDCKDARGLWIVTLWLGLTYHAEVCKTF